MQISDIVSRLNKVKKSGNGYTALCPCHDDTKNSLSVSQGEDGHILISCFTGCSFNDIIKSMGLNSSDVTPSKNDNWKKNETVYKIELPQGGIVEHVRIDEPGGKRFIWRRDGNLGLRGLKLRELPLYRSKWKTGTSGRFVITEGEKASDAASKLGLRSYGTVSGASSCPGKQALEVFRNKDVVLWADNDSAGLLHMHKVQSALKDIAKSSVVIKTGGPKDDAADYEGTIEELESLILSAMGCRKTSILADNASGALNSLFKYSANDNSDRIPFGIVKMDYATRGGMMAGGLYLLGAPSGHGKTTLLQCCAVHCARTRGPVLFVSPEMSGIELAEREAIRLSGVSVNEIAPNKHPNERLINFNKIEQAIDIIKKERLPIHVVEDTDITMSEIGKIAENIPDLKLIIVDYAQEIATRTSTARYLAVGEVGKDAIVIGKKYKVPVMVASQVNVFDDGGKKNYAFRETKDLEHRAHCSMIMEVKRSTEPNRYGYFDVESTRIFARKNRSGAVFSVDVDYHPATFTIKNKTIAMGDY